jgi:uncharacterized OsmC-like protein
VIGFCWWSEGWENDDFPAHNSDLMILHDPALTAVYREELRAHGNRIRKRRSCATNVRQRALPSASNHPMLANGSNFRRIYWQPALRCEARPSSSVLATDAPTDNQGKGEAFSPTDLVATALGTCMATTMAIVAEQHQVELKGMTVQVQKEMASNPRRISRLTSEVHIPLPADHPQRALLEQTALGCRSIAVWAQRWSGRRRFSGKASRLAIDAPHLRAASGAGTGR